MARGMRWSLVLGVALAAGVAAAEDTLVPASLQVELLDKVVAYDRNAPRRVQRQPVVLVAFATGDAASEHAAAQLAAAFRTHGTLGDAPCMPRVVGFVSATALRLEADQSKAGIVMLAPGLEDQAVALGQAFTDWDGLTVSSTGGGVPAGLTLGFVLEQGRPRIQVNISQARRQGVDFRSELLRIVKVTP